MTKYQTISQRTVKDNLGKSELFIQTTSERQASALLKLAMMAKEDVAFGHVSSKDDVLTRLRAARK